MWMTFQFGTSDRLIVNNQFVISAVAVVLLPCVSAFAQVSPDAHNSVCLRASFDGRVNGGDSFSRSLGNRLELHLDPLDDNWGWQLTIRPKGSDDKWDYPVNPPLRSGVSENLGTGYGESARQVLSHQNVIRFTLTDADHVRMSKLADEALSPDRSKQKPEAAEAAYLDALKTVKTGAVILLPLDFDKDGPPEQVRWMKFNAVVIVPQGFRGDTKLNWATGSCSFNLPSGKTIRPIEWP